MILSYKITSLEDTNKLAIFLSKHMKKNAIILLNGDIGVGKTTFAKFFINALSSSTIHNVTSPTFPIVQSYMIDSGIVYHLDLYRIENEKELFSLDLTEIFNHLCLIEWAEKLADLLPKDYIKISIIADGELRTFTLEFSEKYRETYEKIKANYNDL